MQMAPATLSPSPRIPQFISHSRSFSCQGPPIILARFAAGLWCEYMPSKTMVHTTMQTMGKRHDMTAAQKGEMRSGSAYGYFSESLSREKGWW